nr:immunoglobulin heavy chain junction region [Macaca mulatta]MOX38648.1 immunoglobulin heavy chain junction region [Macaca mulatta]MOX38655.1 immunoglobulin heavy chain junction region [Macaca mulatta]MOX39116.1 immunoglobulin heavy chain junction region [Macaca mulatta]MOX39171.1 immunoglobulin heavy chain junction region [Macaca mulatta]
CARYDTVAMGGDDAFDFW